MSADEGAGGELEDQAVIHFLVEVDVEVEVVEDFWASRNWACFFRQSARGCVVC